MEGWYPLIGEGFAVLLLLFFCIHQLREMKRLKAEREERKRREAAEQADAEPPRGV